MSGPIDFDAMPFPVLDDAADGVDAFADLATTADVNFDRVNGYLAGRGNRAAYASTSLSTGTGALNGTNDVRLTNWPVLTFSIPAGTLGVLYTVRANMVATDIVGSLLGVFAVLSGTGFATTIEGRKLEVMLTSGFFTGSRSLLVPAAQLVAGGSVSVAMWAGWYGANGSGNTRVDAGILQALLLRGP